MAEQDVTLTARLDDSEARAKIAALNQQVDELARKLQGLSTGVQGGGIPGAAPPAATGGPGPSVSPAINARTSRNMGTAPPEMPPPSLGNVGTNANGIPNQPIVRTATDGTQVAYNPKTGAWSVIPPVNAGASSNPGAGTVAPGAPPPAGPPPAGPGMPPPVAPPDAPQGRTPGRTSTGLKNAAGMYIGAHAVSGAMNNIAQAYAQASQTGREIQWYDYAQSGGTGIGGIIGAGIGTFLLPGIGTALGFGIGTVIGGGAGSFVDTYAHMREQEGYGTALLKAAGGAGADAFLSSSAFDDKSGKERTTVGALAIAMGRGNTSPYRADLIMSKLLGAAGDSNGARTLAFQQADAIAKGMGNDPAISDFINRPFTQGGAFAMLQAGGPDALMGYLASQGRTEGVYGYIEQHRQTQLAGIHSQLMDIFPQQQAYATTAIAARGGTAGDIAGGMGREVSALRDAAREKEKYIAALEREGKATDSQRIAIEKARTELAGLNAQIATLGNQAATIRSAEAIDIAGTGVSTAQAGAVTAMMTMGRGGNVMGAYSPMLSAQGSMVSTLQAELNRPNLRPEQRREIQRQLNAATVQAMSGMRQAATDVFGFPAQLATLDAGYSGSFAAIAAMGEMDPTRVAGLTARAGQAQGRAAGALWAQYSGMSRSGLFNAVELAQARNAAWGAAAQGLSTLNASSVFSPTVAQEAAMAGFGLQTFAGMQAGGSIGALAGVQGQMGLLGTMGGQAATVYQNALRNGVNANVALANYQRTTAGIGMQQAQAIAALGNFQLSPQAGSALDTAQHAYNMMLASPFVPGNRLTAGTDVLRQLGAARGEAESYLNTAPLDAAGRRSVQQQIYGYQEQEQRLRESLNVGWLSRIASREMFAPSHSAMVGLSNRDYLMVDPTGNRLLGTASRRSYEYTEGGAYAAMPGTGAGARPGDMNAQTVHMVGTLELTGNIGEFLKGIGASSRVSVRSDPNRMLMQKVPTR